MTSKMPPRSKIDDYLAATRGLPASRLASSALVSIYQGLFKDLLEEFEHLMGTDLIAPSLRIQYSAGARVETVLIDDENFVVFDQHLGQAFNRLNLFLETDAPPSRVDSYFYKLSALRLLDNGNPNLAIDYAAMYNLSHSALGPRPASTAQQNALRAVSTRIHEAFALSHELAHLAYGISPDYASTIVRTIYEPAVRTEANLRESEKADIDMDQYMRDTYQRDVEAAWERRYGSIDEEQRQAGRKLFQENFRYSAVKVFTSEVEQVFASPALLEECFCDGLATLLVVGWARRRGIGNMSDVLPLVMDGIQHLRLIRAIDVAASSRWDDEAADELLATTQPRLSLLRLYMGGITFQSLIPSLASKGGRPDFDIVEDARHKLIRRLAAVNERYSRIIQDQFYFHYSADAKSTVQRIRDSGTSDNMKRSLGLSTWDTVIWLCNAPGADEIDPQLDVRK
jgi:hypothetical protein